MKTNFETLQMIHTRDYETLLDGMSINSVNILKSRIDEIPSEFYEPRISIGENKENRISLIEFSLKTASMSMEQRNGLMQKYHIDIYDMDKLQAIVESIRVLRKYGNFEARREEFNNQEQMKDGNLPGIALSSEKKLDRVYPLWVAYLYSTSTNPLEDVKLKLMEDGMQDKYEPEYIVGLINYTNNLMEGKTIEEKEDFYMRSINGILDEEEIKQKKSEIDVEI